MTMQSVDFPTGNKPATKAIKLAKSAQGGMAETIITAGEKSSCFGQAFCHH